MGTVPTPLDPGASTALTSTVTHAWFLTQQFLLNPPACRVYTTATQTLVALAQPAILFGGETVDNVQSGDMEMHSTTTLTERVTIRTAGRYEVSAIAQFNGTGGTNATKIQKNGVDVIQVAQPAASGQVSIAIPTDTITCAVGDYLTLIVSLASGGSTGATWPCSMYVKWVSN